MLRLAHSNNRNSERNGPEDDSTFELKSGEKSFFCELLEEPKLGLLTIKINSTDVDILKDSKDFRLYKEGKAYLWGDWTLKYIRNEEDHSIFLIEHDQSEKLINYSDILMAEDIFLKNKFEWFCLENEEKAASISSHITEIKDLGVQLGVKVRNNDSDFMSAKFDFSSNLKDITTLDFEYEGTPFFRIGEVVFVEYSFLAVRYVFRTKVVDIDEDFEIFSVDLPELLLSFLYRVTERYRTNVKAKIKSNGEPLNCTILNFGVLGCQIELEREIEEEISTEFELLVNSLKVKMSLLRGSGKKLSFVFGKDEQNLKKVRDLMGLLLSDGIELRNKNNYDEFISLYNKVGYAGKREYEEWKTSTLKSWEIQDSRLVGNCVAVLNEDKSASNGQLPISKDVIYGHSTCVVKSNGSIYNLYKCARYSLAYSYLCPQVNYYMGSFRKGSRFTSKMLVTFKNHAQPDFQAIIHTNQIYQKEEHRYEGSGSNFTLEKLEYEAFIECTNYSLKLFLGKIGSENEIFNDCHIKRYYLVKDEMGATRAWIVKHEAPECFTAANMFNYAWAVVDEGVADATSIVDFLRDCKEIGSRNIQLVNSNWSLLPPEYSGPDHQDPAFFTLNKLEDLSTVVGSLARSIYNVIKKYESVESGLIMKVME